MKKKIFLFTFLILFLITYLIISHYIGKYKFINIPIPAKTKLIIKEYIFPFKVIKQQKEKIKKLEKSNNANRIYADGLLPFAIMQEVQFKDSLKNITTDKLEDFTLNNNLILKRNKLNQGFYTGVYNYFPGSGLIDFHNDNLFILSARGVLAFTDFQSF